MGVEIELKFRIPADHVAAVRRALSTATAKQMRLTARYFDTAAQDLARAHLALRLRREGRLWVQTLKAEGATPLQRLEHNVPLLGAPPADVVVALHDGTPAGELLRQVLRKSADPSLHERYATTIDRVTRRIRHRGATIELAFDKGRLSAGELSLPLCELEFELLRGPPSALLDLAARWVEHFALVLDVRSKSERGELLAAGKTVGAPVGGGRIRLPSELSAAQAVQAMLAGALSQTLANAAPIAEAAHEPEHLHQLRVALRRLRNVLRVFGPVLAAPAATDQAGDTVEHSGPVDAARPAASATATDAASTGDPQLLDRLSALYSQLGATRDRDVAAESIWPALRDAGAPCVEWPDEAASDAPALLCEPATQRLWLDLLDRVWRATETTEPTGGAAAADRLRPALRRLQAQVRRDAARFADLDDAGRHRLRRRLKRLSDATELSAALWPARRLSRLLRQLRRARLALGDFNDTVMALNRYRSLASQDPSAWFAVGWLSARRQSLLAPCAQVLARFAALRPLWRDG